MTLSASTWRVHGVVGLLWVASLFMPAGSASASDAGENDTSRSDAGQTPSVPRLDNFTLIDAEKSEPISVFDPIPHRTIVNLGRLPTDQISIRANTTPRKVGRVQFDLDAMTNIQTERILPYAIAGDDPPGQYNPWNPPQGSHIIQARPYTESDTPGIIGRVQIKFTDRPSENSPPAVLVQKPEPMATKPSPATFEVTVKAGDIDGSVERVDLAVQKGPTASTAKESGRWVGTIGPLPEGRHTIEAFARDDSGDISSNSVRVIVTPGPFPHPDAGPSTADTGSEPVGDTGQAQVDVESKDARTTSTADTASQSRDRPDQTGCSCSTETANHSAGFYVFLLLIPSLARWRNRRRGSKG